MVMPVSAAKMGIDPAKADTKLTYQVNTYSANVNGAVDRSGAITYSRSTRRFLPREVQCVAVQRPARQEADRAPSVQLDQG
ncbi:hypothetical protein QJS66_16385 [Kocuria rhizophila]|nr:hypothetical protein QJS66_16385 [Kocuria rhizophila]